MAIFYPDILEQKTAAREFTYRDKDVMLYALGVGMGQDPMNEDELAYVYERNLKVIPTAATVLASNDAPQVIARAAVPVISMMSTCPSVGVPVRFVVKLVMSTV